jgi:hypothetical protein
MNMAYPGRLAEQSVQNRSYAMPFGHTGSDRQRLSYKLDVCLSSCSNKYINFSVFHYLKNSVHACTQWAKMSEKDVSYFYRTSRLGYVLGCVTHAWSFLTSKSCSENLLSRLLTF